MPKCNFNKAVLVTLLKSHFDMGVLLYICCIFSKHLFPHLNEVYQGFVLIHYAVVNSPVKQESERIFYWYFNHLENLYRKIWA